MMNINIGASLSQFFAALQGAFTKSTSELSSTVAQGYSAIAPTIAPAGQAALNAGISEFMKRVAAGFNNTNNPVMPTNPTQTTTQPPQNTGNPTNTGV